MPAFEAAWASGCGWTEADVQPTSDNIPVMFHDDDLARTTNGSGAMRRQSAAQMLGLDAGSWFPTGSSRAYHGTPVPLLADVVAALDADRSLLLEIKAEHTREQVLAELGVIKDSGWDHRVFIESFDPQTLQHVRSVEPGRPVGLLVHALHDDPVGVCTELGAVAYNPEHVLLRQCPELVDELHRSGIAVLAWTADHPDDWAFLADLGVDGIITNVPGELMRWLGTSADCSRSA